MKTYKQLKLSVKRTEHGWVVNGTVYPNMNKGTAVSMYLEHYCVRVGNAWRLSNDG